MRRRPSPSMVVALLALFIALGGTSYAVIKLPAASVGNRELKRDAVTASKIRNGSVGFGGADALRRRRGEARAGRRAGSGLAGRQRGELGARSEPWIPLPFTGSWAELRPARVRHRRAYRKDQHGRVYIYAGW